MKKIDFGQTITIIANIGVIAGIAFLAIEIQQNTAAVEGATYQALADGTAAQHVSVSANPALAAMLARVYGGETRDAFTVGENSQLWYHYNAVLQRLENAYFQNRSGLADDRVFESYGWNDEDLYRSPHFSDYWEFFASRRNTSTAFRTFFEDRFDISSGDSAE
jgi:hypothetical protein